MDTWSRTRWNNNRIYYREKVIGMDGNSIIDLVTTLGLASGIAVYLIKWSTTTLKESIDELKESVKELKQSVDELKDEILRRR